MQIDAITKLVEQAREQLTAEFRTQADQIQKLEQSVQELRTQQQRLEESVGRRLDDLAKAEIPGGPAGEPGGAAMLEQVLAGVRDLITATLPEQVLEVLTEEGAKLGVRAAIFDVRGKAAWGSSARGFAGLSDRVFRSVVVPLSQDAPFRTCFETAGHVDANPGMLKKNRNVLEKLKPDSEDSILLLPIRSAGSVSAIFYCDSGGKQQPLPVDALKILAEFAGAQLDRLMAFSGGMPPAAEIPAEAQEIEAEPMTEPAAGTPEAEPAVAAESVEAGPVVEAGQPPEAVPMLGETVPVESAPPASAPEMPEAPTSELPPPPVAAVVGFDLARLSEEEQKGHRDAKRFAKLLVSEIELYNKAKVQDGRKNRDLYKRLKSDIDRSRQTYEKRFGKSVGKQYDYFHEETVRILAGSDASLLGPDYPGPTV
jgi:hypothetical protein